MQPGAIPSSRVFTRHVLVITNNVLQNIKQIRICITKLGCKDFGAPKLKLGFTRQKFCIGIRRRLMCLAY